MEHLEISVFCMKRQEILTYLIPSLRPRTIFLAGNMTIVYVRRSLQLKRRIITHKIFWRKHIPGLPLAFISTWSFCLFPSALTSWQMVAGTQSLRKVYFFFFKKKHNIEKILYVKLMCSGNWNVYFSILVKETYHWACRMLVFQVGVGWKLAQMPSILQSPTFFSTESS